MHSVREFLEASFKYVGKEILWEGKGEEEVGREKDTGIIRYRYNCTIYLLYSTWYIPPHVKIFLLMQKVNPKYYRPTEVDQLLGDPSKAQAKLG